MYVQRILSNMLSSKLAELGRQENDYVGNFHSNGTLDTG